jgi:hypothetical protein
MLWKPRSWPAFAISALFHPFTRTTERRWLVVRNQHASILESRELAPDIDLRRLFIASMLE